MESSRLWIDVTDMILWRQRKTGTQRVIQDMITAFSTIRPIGLVYYSMRLSAFYDVQISDYFQHAVEAEESRLDNLRSYWLFGNSNRVPPAFREGDSLLILGGDWRRKGFLARVAELRSDLGMDVCHFVHDVMPITTPHLFPADETNACRRYLTRAFRVVDSVVTSSLWNVGQIASLVEAGVLTSRPIHPVGLGTTSLASLTPIRPPIDVRPGEFTLSVGTFELKKNRRVIYQAYKLANEVGIRVLPIVLVGQPGGIPDEGVRLLQEDPSLEGLVVTVKDTSDAQLAWLYRNSAFTIFGSLSEGWGMPIDESLSLGTPCLCSNTSAMPEVGATAALYFNPQSASSLLERMEEVLDCGKLRQHRERIGGAYSPKTWVEVCESIERCRGSLT